MLHYKERYEKEKDFWHKKIDYIKLIIADDYSHDSQEEDKQADKKPDKKDPLKKPTIIDAKEFSKLITREETDMNR